MALTRLGHDDGSLRRFYTELADRPGLNGLSRIGQQMLEFLPLLEAALKDEEVWTLTSHERLCLINEARYDAPWCVIVQAVPWGGFAVRYRLPDDQAPWPGAMVEGSAENVDRAVEMVQVGMTRSNGWRSKSGRPTTS